MWTIEILVLTKGVIGTIAEFGTTSFRNLRKHFSLDSFAGREPKGIRGLFRQPPFLRSGEADNAGLRQDHAKEAEVRPDH